MRNHSLCLANCLKTMRAAAVLAAILFAMLEGAASAQTSVTTLRIAGSPRPVLQAVMDLTSKYGYVITYEDPRYVYQNDMKDVTQERRDLSRYAAGKAPKAYQLIGGSLTLTLPNGTPIDESTMYGLLEELVQSWFESGEGGHFQVQQQDGIFHIVPSEVRDGNGNWQSTQSILDSPISLPRESRDDWQTYKAIGRAVSVVVGVRVITLINGGIVVGGALDTKQYALDAQDEPASSVLSRAFNIMKKRRTWYLLYEPTLRAYVLNVDDVPNADSTQPAVSVSEHTPGATATGPSGETPSARVPKCMPSAVTPPCGA